VAFTRDVLGKLPILWECGSKKSGTDPGMSLRDPRPFAARDRLSAQLPRFNMPLELSLFLGAKKFYGRTKRRKVCLVMDTEKYRYRNFCSDLAGVDIEAHSGDILELVRVVRNWLRTNQEVQEIIPSGDHIFERYKEFLAKLPEFCERFRLNPKAIIFRDYISVLEAWLLEHDWRAPQTP
jgi:hypothetical protein